jgi:para-aminobenzoate synthetase/4-amino-4-deoxychorismate lyase
MSMREPRIVLQAPVDNRLAWLELVEPREVLAADELDQVVPTLARAADAGRAGRIAAGFVSYEAAPAFEPAMVAQGSGARPLAWFGIFDRATTLSGLPPASGEVANPIWQSSLTPAEHEEGVAAIHRHIAAGDTYQVNFTHRLTARLRTDPWTLFVAMSRGQQARCCAYVDTGDRVLCSASPELFFRLEDERIWSRPMKGTAPRGRTLAEDRSLARRLQTSAKDRAENLMIVDMLRNDLGRIAEPDSVAVSHLWQLEKYPSLWQMTSTIGARSRRPVEEIFGALFPCASVTGAPKIRAMEIIQQLEGHPRGVYTGAIGVIGPGRRARFNVAIRTAEVESATGRATYGTGSGVVWDSSPADEWRECATKALVLRPAPPRFELLETMLWEPEGGVALRDRHLQRLEDSADYFAIPLERQVVEAALEQAVGAVPRRPHRVRLLVDAHGRVRTETEVLEHRPRPWRVALATEPVSSDDPFLFHKTTHRQVYDRHRARFPDHDDVLLWNERGEVTEATLANVVYRRGNRWLTPPVTCGLLGGTLRAELLELGRLAEAPLRVSDLSGIDDIRLINSVRQWIEIELDQAPIGSAAETRQLDPP